MTLRRFRGFSGSWEMILTCFKWFVWKVPFVFKRKLADHDLAALNIPSGFPSSWIWLLETHTLCQIHCKAYTRSKKKWGVKKNSNVLRWRCSSYALIKYCLQLSGIHERTDCRLQQRNTAQVHKMHIYSAVQTSSLYPWLVGWKIPHQIFFVFLPCRH